MKTPSITPAQILAFVTAVLGMLVTMGLIDDAVSQSIAGVAATAIPLALIMADTMLRRTRAQNAEAILGAKAVQAVADAHAAKAKAAAVEAARLPQDADVEALGPYDGT